ncbi:unnamed protein product, partial [Laminaria digitata]
QSKIDDDVFVKFAPGHELTDAAIGVPIVVKLKRSLHRALQSPAQWRDTIDNVAAGYRFTPTLSDP